SLSRTPCPAAHAFGLARSPMDLAGPQGAALEGGASTQWFLTEENALPSRLLGMGALDARPRAPAGRAPHALRGPSPHGPEGELQRPAPLRVRVRENCRPLRPRHPASRAHDQLRFRGVAALRPPPPPRGRSP